MQGPCANIHLQTNKKDSKINTRIITRANYPQICQIYQSPLFLYVRFGSKTGGFNCKTISLDLQGTLGKHLKAMGKNEDTERVYHHFNIQFNAIIRRLLWWEQVLKFDPQIPSWSGMTKFQVHYTYKK